MDQTESTTVHELGAEIIKRLRALAVRKVAPLRALRREFSKRVAKHSAQAVVALGLLLLEQEGLETRFIAYELVCHHRAALRSLGARELEQFGRGLLPVVSLHNQYWIWGPGAWDGKVALFVNLPPELKSSFDSAEVIERAQPSLAVPEENGVAVWLVRGLHGSASDFWKAHRKLQ